MIPESERKPRACELCGATFTPTTTWARYCSQRCRVRAHRAAQRREPTPLEAALEAALEAVRARKGERAALDRLRRLLEAPDAPQAGVRARKTSPGLLEAPGAPQGAPRAPSAGKTSPGLLVGLRRARAAAARGASPLLGRFERAVEAGKTATEIALAIGLADASSISRWRKGGRPLSANVAARLESYLASEGF